MGEVFQEGDECTLNCGKSWQRRGCCSLGLICLSDDFPTRQRIQKPELKWVLFSDRLPPDDKTLILIAYTNGWVSGGRGEGVQLQDLSFALGWMLASFLPPIPKPVLKIAGHTVEVSNDKYTAKVGCTTVHAFEVQSLAKEMGLL